MGSSRLLKTILTSSLISYACVHPLVMVISQAMPASSVDKHQLKTELGSVFWESFSISMLPWSLGFAILGGILGWFYYKNRLDSEVKAELLNKLQTALNEVKMLSGFLPICCVCKQIRDDKGDWNHIELYISENSEAIFSHTYCPDCGKTSIDSFLKEENRKK